MKLRFGSSRYVLTSPDLNTTTSVLTFTPTVDDAGKYLSCRGQQAQISDSGIEDGWKLDIHHVPLVFLELGSPLNGSVIKEGVDVYFECNIKSNPWVYKVSWRHNGKQLYNKADPNTIVSNQSLVLQSITRARSGLYTCVGHNQEGDGESNPVQLDVKFAPVCRPGQAKVFGAAKLETIRIPCELEASPGNDVKFFWTFNNTSTDSVNIPSTQLHNEHARSTLAYKVTNEIDYGTLLCWGRNQIGMQKDPCVFHVTPAGNPETPSNCSITNQTVESVRVECNEGFDGGLQQIFIMEVYDIQTRKLVSNVTSRNPIFSVAGLDSGWEFDVAVYASNGKGRSNVAHLQAFTLKSAQKHTGALAPVFLQITPTLAMVIAVVLALILLAILIVVVIRVKGGDGGDHSGGKNHHHHHHHRHGNNIQKAGGGGGSIGCDSKEFNECIGGGLGGGGGGGGDGVGGSGSMLLVGGGSLATTSLTMSSGRRRCSTGPHHDKESCEPLNQKPTPLCNDSIDSLELEKNPDIIPQQSEDDYLDEERAFDRLQSGRSSTLRPYRLMCSPKLSASHRPPIPYTAAKTTDDLTYAELALHNQQLTVPSHMICTTARPQQQQQQPQSHPNQSIPMSIIRRQEPTVYAQLDMKRFPQPPLSSPHVYQPQQLQHPQQQQPHHILPFQTLHHPHLQPLYMARTARDGTEQPLLIDNTCTSMSSTNCLTNHRASPLINARSVNSPLLQPLLEEGNGSDRKPMIMTQTTAGSKLNATRF